MKKKVYIYNFRSARPFLGPIESTVFQAQNAVYYQKKKVAGPLWQNLSTFGERAKSLFFNSISQYL